MVVGCIDNNGGDPIGRLGDRQIEGRELHNGDNHRERRGKGKTEGKGNRREGRDLLLSSWETEIGGRYGGEGCTMVTIKGDQKGRSQASEEKT